MAGRAFWLLTILAITACEADSLFSSSSADLTAGTWGGDNAGMIIGKEAAHVHIGCTLGDVDGFVRVDDDGRFNVSGSYVLRAFPVLRGPSFPASFTGRVTGSQMRLTVIVHDTLQNQTVTLGPVELRYGKDPRMGPCPICRKSS